jgi:ATP-dependent DNA helicase RecQ
MIPISTQLSLLKTYFGFDSFRPNQQAIINDIFSGKDVLAIMPTGGGKSLCFQLPALALPGTAIVISPLIALMKDQVDALLANGIVAGLFNSSQTPEAQRHVLNKLQDGLLKLLYVAPESLPLLLPHLAKIKVSLVAVDEAHCISSWGHDFRPAYTQLGQLKNSFPNVPVLAFTATADRATQDDILEQLHIPEASKHLASFDRKNLYLEVLPGTNRLKEIGKFLQNRGEESGIIYCLSRKSTELLAEKLNAMGYASQAYHAGLPSDERSRIQEDFVNDRTPIIVATIAFGMGIDKSNVRWVIHYNMPKNIEGYYQEIGRSGRDGLPAHTLLFYSYADVIQMRQFISGTPTEDFQLAKLERMQQFCEALSCRRIALLNYFGEHSADNCGNCDNCKTPPQFMDGTILAQKVCSVVHRLQEQEALGVVIDVLRGAKNATVLHKGYHLLKTYGAASDMTWEELQHFCIQLINQGVLEIRFHENSRLILTPLAKKILFEGKTVKLASLQQKNTTYRNEQHEKLETLGLFDKLRKLRSEIALEEHVPAYIIFGDATLKDIELKLPENESDFLKISGVGQVKNDKYAARFLQLIKEHLVGEQKKQPTHLQTYALYKKGMSLQEIAHQRNLKEDTLYNHLIKLNIEGISIDLHQYLAQEDLLKVKAAQKILGNDVEGLKPYYQYFDEQMPYWKIRLALYLSNLKTV